MDLGLKNKSVVVTGGNRGIGRAIALAFAGEGANVAIVGRDTDALATVKGEIEATGVKGSPSRRICSRPRGAAGRLRKPRPRSAGSTCW